MHLDVAQDVLNTRVREIDAYFGFLYEVIDGRAALSVMRPYGRQQGQTREVKEISNDVIHGLKANGYLLLYNMVEATVRQAMLAIQEHIETNDHHYDELHDGLRRHIADLFRKDDALYGMIQKSNHPISKGIIMAGFRANKLFSGNIHHESLEKIAKKIGFSVSTDETKTKGGRRLTDVKERRNRLAHGNQSFIDCGRETSIDELLEIKSEVIAYLVGILQNIDEFLSRKGYLSVNSNVM